MGLRYGPDSYGRQQWGILGNGGNPDVAIYLLGLSEILGIDLEQEILKKIEKNSKRIYKKVDGVNIKIEG